MSSDFFIDLAKRSAKKVAEESIRAANKGIREIDKIVEAAKNPPDEPIIRDLVNVRRSFQSTIDRMTVTIENLREKNTNKIPCDEFVSQMKENMALLSKIERKYGKDVLISAISSVPENIFYRVRHPACPDLFVWHVQGLNVQEQEMGKFAELKIVFAEYRGPMTKESAEELAAQCGGTIEAVKYPKQKDILQ